MVTVLVAAPIAQTQNQTPPPPPPTGQQATPPPTTPAPALPTPPKPAVPFPAGAKIGFVSLGAILGGSKLGKAGTDEMQAFMKKGQDELAAKQNAINNAETELRAQASLLSPEAREAKQRDIDRQKRELEYRRNDLNAEMGALNERLVKNLEAKVLPILESIRTERDLWVIFADQGSNEQAAAGLSVVSYHQGLDLTPEVIKRLDAATPATGASGK
jgi:outer membrane protein